MSAEAFYYSIIGNKKIPLRFNTPKTHIDPLNLKSRDHLIDRTVTVFRWRTRRRNHRTSASRRWRSKPGRCRRPHPRSSPAPRARRTRFASASPQSTPASIRFVPPSAAPRISIKYELRSISAHACEYFIV